MSALDVEAVIDGEVVPARGEQILPFNELQKRLGRKTIGAELLREVPVILVAYDLLYARGRVLTDESLEERRKILEEMIPTEGTVRVSVAKRFEAVAALDQEFDDARARGNEGLMIKESRVFLQTGPPRARVAEAKAGHRNPRCSCHRGRSWTRQAQEPAFRLHLCRAPL